MTKAIIFIRPGVSDDAERTREGLEHAERQGYGFVALIRDWDQVLDLVCRRLFSVVVFGRPRASRLSDVSDEGETRELPRRMVGEQTVTLPRSAIPLSRDRVRELLDTDVTAPIGLDPETLAAARRLARHFAQCAGG